MHCTGGILLPRLALSGIHKLQVSHMCGSDFEDELQAATHESSCQSTSSNPGWRGRRTPASSIRCRPDAHHACVSRSAAHAYLLAHSCRMEQKDGRLLGPCAALFAAASCYHTSSKAMPDCTGYLPGISGGLQSLLLDPSTLSSLYGAMGTSSGAFLALSQLPGINMDAVQVPTSHAATKLMAAAYEHL